MGKNNTAAVFGTFIFKKRINEVQLCFGNMFLCGFQQNKERVAIGKTVVDIAPDCAERRRIFRRVNIVISGSRINRDFEFFLKRLNCQFHERDFCMFDKIPEADGKDGTVFISFFCNLVKRT